MNSTLELVGAGVAAPAGVAIAVMLLAPRVLADDLARRYTAAWAFGLAFFVGYALLPDWAAMVPKRHWQWLPYLGLAAMVIGPVALASGVRAFERGLLHLLLALVAAWFLVPTWASLEPPRGVMIAFLSADLFVLTMLLDPLAERIAGPIFPALLALSAGGVAILTAAFVSLTYGQLAGLAASALAGCAAAGRSRAGALGVRGLVPGYAVLVGGSAFVGFVEPQPNLPGLLLAAHAPLALWACAFGPLGRLRGALALIVRMIAVLVPLGVAVIVIMMRQGPSAGEGY